MTIDLHIHSTASDGTDTPEEIVSHALKTGLRAISITDHDTVSGVSRVSQACMDNGIEFISGVELSSYVPEPFKNKGNFHILGYGIDIQDPDLVATLELLRKAREERNPLMIKKLQDLGMDICYEDVCKESGNMVVGRPHMARVLIKKGYVSSIEEAFDKFLAKGKPAFEDKYRLDCEKALNVIKNAGGVPVLAHPLTIDIICGGSLNDLINVMKEKGLMGIEVYYSTHTEKFTEEAMALTEKFGLLATGGSDYHGSLKNNIQMGTGKGTLSVPYNLYLKLREAISK